MRIDLNKIANQLINKYLVILFSVFVVSVISGFGLTNFKLDASSDALVLENDESLKAYREAEDGIRDLVRSRGLGDVYKRQLHY